MAPGVEPAHERRAALGLRLGCGRLVRLRLRLVRFGGDVFAVVLDRDAGVELLIVGVADRGAQVGVLGESSVGAREMKDAFGAGVGGEPVFAVDLLVVRGEGRGDVFFAAGDDLGNVQAVAHDDLEILLVDPDLALKVAVAFDDLLGRDVEDVGLEIVDLLLAKVVDVVVRELRGGEDERQTVFDVVDVVLGDDHLFDGVLGGEDDVLDTVAGVVEGDVGDLLHLAVGLAVVVVDGLHFDDLAEDVLVAGVFELGFLLTHAFKDVGHGDAGGLRGVERTEAGDVGVAALGAAEGRGSEQEREGGDEG